ncbi:MAG: TetR family transcriptional regulator C-terminal domain-containing protein, partial [Clostridia bacterium]|nr:TetR family transcriptional regulator C-terminal domain-containing protein [Clostridia bacterium]
LLLPVVEEEAVGMEISDQGKHSIAIFYTYALVGVVLDWIRMGMQMSPEQVMTTTSVVIEGDIKNSLKNMQQYEAGKTNEL